MATQLLPKGTGAGVTGKWVRTEGGWKDPYPMRVQAAGNFGGTGLVIEELVGGSPGFPTNSPFGSSVDTGDVNQIGVPITTQGDLIINEPVAFLRARTLAGMSGTVDYCGVEFAE